MSGTDSAPRGSQPKRKWPAPNMSVREKLAHLLRLAGLRCQAENLWPAQGSWRTDRRLDTYPWEGQATNAAGMLVNLSSWDTMSDCVRYGITLAPDPPSYVDVHANSPVGR